MGNQISQLTASDTSAPQIQLPKAGPAGPKGDKGDKGDPGNPSLLLGTADFKNAVNKAIDPNVLKPKSLELKYPGITDTEAILKLYGVETGTSNYFLMKGGHGESDNITIDALGNIVTNGNISEGQRLLGTPDGSGNFWMGLRGSGSEDERLAMGVSGEANTGKVKQVNVRKDLSVEKNLTINGNTTLGNTVLQNAATFKVGGKSDTFYPVIFVDNGWNNGQYRLEISRANVHQDSGWRGSMRFICEGHTTNWGHGSDSMDFYYISSNARDNSGNQESFDTFVANAVNWWAASYIIVWLRGNTSYQWRSLTGMTLQDGNPEGVDKQSINIGTAEKPRFDTWAQRKDIEGRFNLAAKYYDGAKLNGRPSTRFFDGDIEIPSGRHLWIRDKYHGITYGPDDGFAGSQDGPIVFGYGGGSLGSTQNGNKKVAMTWDINNDVVAKNSLVVQRDLVVNGGMYPLESIRSQAGHNLYMVSDGGASNVISGKGAYAQLLSVDKDGKDSASVLAGQGYVSLTAPNTNITGNVNMKDGGRINFSWDSDVSSIGLKDYGNNSKHLAITYGDDNDDRLRFIHKYWDGTETEKMSMDRYNIYAPGKIVATNNAADDYYSSAIQIGPDNDIGKDTNIYSLTFGGGQGMNAIGMGLLKTSKAMHPDSTEKVLGTHIRPKGEWGIYSDGWDKLFSVQGGSGNVRVKGNMYVNNICNKDGSKCLF